MSHHRSAYWGSKVQGLNACPEGATLSEIPRPKCLKEAIQNRNKDIYIPHNVRQTERDRIFKIHLLDAQLQIKQRFFGDIYNLVRDITASP